ncbi:MAG: DUF2330 domain-containing protein [Bradymonadaceae bacterium]
MYGYYKPEADAGDIEPLKLTLRTDRLALPLRIAAATASESLDILAFFIADGRVAPTNYRRVRLNDAVIDWFEPSTNYSAVLGDAVREAGGRAFATEYAGRPAGLLPEYKRPQTDGDTDQDVTMRALWKEAPAPVADAFQQAEMRLEGRTLTRLHTVLEPSAMTEDPVFTVRPQLGDVSRWQTARRTTLCSPSVRNKRAPWKVELPSGLTLGVEHRRWPVVGPVDDMPSALRVYDGGKRLQHNDEAVQKALPRPKSPGALGFGYVGCDCHAPGDNGSLPPLWFVVVILGAVALRYR